VSRLSRLVGDQDPMRLLEETPGAILRLIAPLDPASRARRADPARWSVNEIVAHLADAEVVGAYRLRTMVATSGAPLAAFDQDRWARAFDYGSLDAVESAGLFAACRRGSLRYLRRLAPEQFECYGVHAERGPESVSMLVRLYAGHDLNHLQQIERAAALGDGGPGTAPFVPAPQKPEIPLDVLERVDLRVGTIHAVEAMPGARHVVRLTVGFGAERRTVIAGLKDERADPRELAGRQALFYYNLAPRRIHGEESRAMLCDIGHADGLTPALAVPESPVPDGARAG
jgi:tRNA-binding EMAP/Myf-like protein